MTDHWEDVRKMFGDGKIESVPGQAVRNLLTDADALLAVVKELQESAEVIAAEYESVGGPEVHRSWRDVMLQLNR